MVPTGPKRLVISPVSLEPLAIMFPILHVRASDVILLQTNGSEAVFDRIKGELERRGISVRAEEPVGPTDAKGIVDGVRRALAHWIDARAVVNVTPGTKVMSVAAALEAAGNHCELVYADTGDDRIWTFTDGTWVDAPLSVPGLDVNFFVGLAGREARKGIPKGSWPTLAAFIGANAPALDGLLDPLRGPGLRGSVSLKHRRWSKMWGETLDRAVSEGLVAEWAHQPDSVTVLFRNHQAVDYLAGGYWLEDYAYGVALDCGFEQVNRNVEILRPDGLTHTDLDVAFISRHRLFVVSCKSGKNLEHRQPFDELVENVGGLLAGAMVVSTKHAGQGVAAVDVGHARGVRVETALLDDVPKLRERLLAMSTQVARRRRAQAL
jgi:Card1-like endonuclease family protein/uncharacterized protein DUF6293